MLDNKAVILETVKKDGEILCMGSTRLRNDCEVVLEALKSNYKALQYIGERLKNNHIEYSEILEKAFNRYFSPDEKNGFCLIFHMI